MSLFTNKESVSLYQQNAFFAMKRCFHQMKRILKMSASVLTYGTADKGVIYY